jgi:hypothetical protein
MPLPSARDIVELVKTGATIEAQEKIMELRSAALDRQEEILELRAKVSKLEQELAALKAGESCPKCRAGKWLLESSQPHPTFGAAGVLQRTYKCDQCGFSEAKTIDSRGNSR